MTFNRLIGGPSDEQFPPEDDEWECPCCGSREGQPLDIYWREFQGDEAHGGWVDLFEEACTVCQGEVP